MLSALKPARNGDVLLRVYEATGKPVQNGVITFTPQLVSASESNVVEDEGSLVRISGNAIACQWVVRDQELQAEIQTSAEAVNPRATPANAVSSVCAEPHEVQPEMPRRRGDFQPWPDVIEAERHH